MVEKTKTNVEMEIEQQQKWVWSSFRNKFLELGMDCVKLKAFVIYISQDNCGVITAGLGLTYHYPHPFMNMHDDEERFEKKGLSWYVPCTNF